MQIPHYQLFDVRHFLQGRKYSGWQLVFVGLKANVEALVQGAKSQGLLYGTEAFLAFRIGVAHRIRELAERTKVEALAADPAYGQLVHIGSTLANRLIFP
jgi:hypothetical protein